MPPPAPLPTQSTGECVCMHKHAQACTSVSKRVRAHTHTHTHTHRRCTFCRPARVDVSGQLVGATHALTHTHTHTHRRCSCCCPARASPLAVSLRCHTHTHTHTHTCSRVVRYVMPCCRRYSLAVVWRSSRGVTCSRRRRWLAIVRTKEVRPIGVRLCPWVLLCTCH
jgi:hypothetical protein